VCDPPDSGGSFGIKLSVFPYMVLVSIAARITGRPVKWVEDRAEHLLAASTARTASPRSKRR
jgi:2-furoyl-CoA dehydrogenase large subunit